MATSYTIDGQAVTSETVPIRACASCGRDASRVDLATLNCVHCGGNPFVAPAARASLADAWNAIRAQLEQAHMPAPPTPAQPLDAEAAERRHCGMCERVTEWLPDGRCCGCVERQNGQDAYYEAFPEPAERPSGRTHDGGSPAYRALLDAAWQLHIDKNAGYAGYSPDPWANFRQCESFGISAADGVLTRMSDKWSRLQSLWRNPERDRVGESVEDTLKDLSAYALILICLLQEGN